MSSFPVTLGYFRLIQLIDALRPMPFSDPVAPWRSKAHGLGTLALPLPLRLRRSPGRGAPRNGLRPVALRPLGRSWWLHLLPSSPINPALTPLPCQYPDVPGYYRSMPVKKSCCNMYLLIFYLRPTPSPPKYHSPISHTKFLPHIPPTPITHIPKTCSLRRRHLYLRGIHSRSC